MYVVVLMCISFHLCETRQQVPQDTLQRSLCASVQSNTFIHQRHILLFFGAWQASDSSHDKKSSTQPWWVCPSFPLTASRLVLAPLQVHGCKVNVSHQRQRQRQRHRERERDRERMPATSTASRFTSHRKRVTAHKGSFQIKAQWVSTKLQVEEPQRHSERRNVSSSQNQLHWDLWGCWFSPFVWNDSFDKN